MKSVKVLKASYITKLNRVIVTLDNGLAFGRSTNQFITDLKESNMIAPNVTSINHPAVLGAMRGLVGSAAYGDIEQYKAGSEYEITEKHPALTNKEHPLYGKAKLGQMVACEKDGARVESGFVTFVPNIQWEQVQANAAMTAATSFLDSLFATPAKEEVPTGNPEDAFGNDPIADEKKAIAGAASKAAKAGK